MRLRGLRVTHDELLARMKELSRVTADEPNFWFDDALRAVVELHKPQTPTSYPKRIVWNKKTFTNRFFYDDECAIDGKLYPCPTIQKIIENLK